MDIIDSHLHLFKAFSKNYPRPIYDGLADKNKEVLAKDLIHKMDKAGVNKAIVVPLGPEDNYLSELQAEYPGKFASVGVFNPEEKDFSKNLDRRIEKSNIQGLRIGFVDKRKDINEEPRKFELFPLFEAMADRNLKVWFYSEPDQVKKLERVMELLPELIIIFNHCGFMVSLDNLSIDQYSRPHFNVKIPPPTLDLLEQISSKPNTFVHFSGQYAFSHEAYPHFDMLPVAQRLLSIFGPERMLWASDFPWIDKIPGYSEQLNLVESLLQRTTKYERDLIKGGNASNLFSF